MEKILVGLKRAVDYNVRVRVKNDGSGVETGDGFRLNGTADTQRLRIIIGYLVYVIKPILIVDN